MDMSQTEWKRTGEKYSQLNAACMTFRKLRRQSTEISLYLAFTNELNVAKKEKKY